MNHEKNSHNSTSVETWNDLNVCVDSNVMQSSQSEWELKRFYRKFIHSLDKLWVCVCAVCVILCCYIIQFVWWWAIWMTHGKNMWTFHTQIHFTVIRMQFSANETILHGRDAHRVFVYVVITCQFNNGIRLGSARRLNTHTHTRARTQHETRKMQSAGNKNETIQNKPYTFQIDDLEVNWHAQCSQNRNNSQEKSKYTRQQRQRRRQHHQQIVITNKDDGVSNIIVLCAY